MIYVVLTIGAAQHSGYWSQYPGNYEHWRFSEGFMQGWDDAWSFFTSVSMLPPSASVPELGFKGPWAKKRVQAHVAAKGGNNLWEYGACQHNMAGSG